MLYACFLASVAPVAFSLYVHKQRIQKDPPCMELSKTPSKYKEARVSTVGWVWVLTALRAYAFCSNKKLLRTQKQGISILRNLKDQGILSYFLFFLLSCNSQPCTENDHMEGKGKYMAPHSTSSCTPSSLTKARDKELVKKKKEYW